MRTADLRRPWAGNALALVGCALVFAAAWWWLERSLNRLPTLERDLLVTINGWPDGLQLLLGPIMQLGNVWVCVIGSLAALVLFRRPAPAITVAIATFGAWLLAKVVKEVVSRGRPAELLASVQLRDGDSGGFGFVSGHAAVAFALATALAPWLPRRWHVVLAYALATLVALARVFVGAHFPLDVVGGAALGVACGLVGQLVVGVPAARSSDVTSS